MNNVSIYEAILEEDLKQQPVSQSSPKYILMDSRLKIELMIPFASNRDLQESPQQPQLGDIVHCYPTK